ncbi:MAG: hypothetical protein ORN29_05645 [Rhodoferax sp.]|nr:hypothetical protein [Rhodoferax sp.]
MLKHPRHAPHIDNRNKASGIWIDYAEPQYQQMVADLRSGYDALADEW